MEIRRRIYYCTGDVGDWILEKNGNMMNGE